MMSALTSGQVVLYRVKDLTVVLYRKTANCSEAWNSFGKLKYKDEVIDNGRIYCNVCLESAREDNKEQTFASAEVKSFSDTCATSNMNTHLRVDHQLVFTKAKLNNNTMKTYFSTNGPNMVAPVHKTSLFHRNIALWFAKDLIAFNEIGLEGISDFLLKYKVISCKTDLPHPTTLARGALNDVYDATKEAVLQMLADSPDHGSLTVDMWSDSHAHRKYPGFTYHYINADWELVNATLRVASLPVAHTGENIKTEIKKTLKNFNLKSNSITVLRDNGANIILACRLGNYPSYGCVGHGLHNLVMKDGVSNVAAVGSLLTKCRVIVRSLAYKSEELLLLGQEEVRNSLEKIAELESVLVSDSNVEVESGDDEPGPVASPTTLKRDEPTRWSSMLEMFQSLLRNRRAVTRMLALVGKSDEDLDEEEYELVEELVKFLNLFKVTTQYLSGSKYPTSNLALLLRSEISSTLQPSAADSRPVKSLKSFMRQRLDKRFPVTDHIVLAALLDPRLQNLNEISNYLEEKHQSKVQFLQSHATDFANEIAGPAEVQVETNDGPSDPKQNCIRDLIEKHSSHQLASVGLEHEVTSLLTSRTEPNDDALAFWKKNASKFPTLAQMANCILGIPATSVPCERLFSIAGLVVTAKRASLKPFSVDRLVFVHDNYVYGKKYANM